MKKHIRNFILGIFMGFGEIIPGVGAQTAMILIGVYNETIQMIYQQTELVRVAFLFIIRKSTFDNVKKAFWAIPWSYSIFAPLASIITLLLLSGPVSDLVEHYPMTMFAAAFGIVLATITIPFKEMPRKSWKELVIFIVSVVAFLILFSQQPGLLREYTNPFMLFFAGIICSLAGFFPGISVSFALVLLGVYQYLLKTARNIPALTATPMDWMNLIAFGLGIMVGGFLLIRLLKAAFTRYPSQLLAFILGLIVASLYAVWPFMDTNSSVDPEKMTKILPTNMDPMFILFIFSISAGMFIIITTIRYFAEKRSTIAKSSFGFDSKELKQFN
jgi:putative membrane protein